MTAPVIELVVYKVKNPKTAATARALMRPHVESFPGFLGWQAVTSTEHEAFFADILTWASLAEAKAASEKVMADPQCAPFMAEIAEMVSYGHYA